MIRALSTRHPQRIAVLGWTLVALAPFLQAVIVRIYGVNMMIWDEFFYVPFIQDLLGGEEWTWWIWLQHNEHRMTASKLVFAFLAPATSWNVLAEMYFSVILAALIVWGCWRIFRRSTGKEVLLFVPIAWLICSPVQFFNMLTGIQTAFYFTALGLVWSCASLAAGTPFGLFRGVGFAALASFSTINGFIAWPVGLVQLIATKARKTSIAVWLAAGALCGWRYFRHYEQPPHIKSRTFALHHPVAAAHYFFENLGASIGGGNAKISTLAGFLVLGGLIASAASDLRRRSADGSARIPLYALAAAGVLSSAFVAMGRLALGISQALESRYTTFSLLAVVAMYALVIARADVPRLQAVAALALCAGVAAGAVTGIHSARWWRKDQERRRHILLTFEDQPDAELHQLYFIPDVRSLAATMKAARLGPFHDEPAGPAPPLPVRTTRPKKLHRKGFRVGWKIVGPLPGSIPRGGVFSLDVAATNLGDEIWPDRDPGAPPLMARAYCVRLASRWLSGNQIVRDYGQRVDLSHPVRPGDSVVWRVQVAAPPVAGDYKLQIDLIQELVAWFADKGADNLVLRIRVT
jgi:hypothetical protein